MTLHELLHTYSLHSSVATLRKLLTDDSVRSLHCAGLHGSSAPLLFASTFEHDRQTALYILNDAEEAGYFYHDLSRLLGASRVLYFPSSYRRAMKYGHRDAANEILRTEVLSRLSHGGEGLAVVTYPDALVESVVSVGELSDKTLPLHKGERIDLSFVADVLHSYGFECVDYVYEPGQYAVRGSIIDVFSYSCEWPFRIDFFGSEVDTIRTFEIDTQLSHEQREQIVIIPMLQGKKVDATSLLQFLPSTTCLVVKDLAWICDRLTSVAQQGELTQAALVEQSEEGATTDTIPLIDAAKFCKELMNLRRIEFGAHPIGVAQVTIQVTTAVQPIFHKNFDLVSSSLKEYLQQGYTIYICSDSIKQIDRIRSIFDDRGDDIPFVAIEQTVHEGFVDEMLKICVFTDHQLFDRFHKYSLRSDKARSGKLSLSLKELNQFAPGDYVVHTDHGVGRFAGLVRMPNGNSTQEVIKLIYQNEDVVFVSIHSLHKVSKYKGKEGEPPRLNKLGTGAWEKLKERTKSKIKDIARDLIKLYAERQKEQGYAYSPDSFLQHELEASFLYEDTPDQHKATAAVKADMESNRPMDRLVCGDVGFGKTEVAIRAAFKAVSDNKQVAVLVPTTVLAYQHYQTFSRRLKGMPCRVDYISRARTAKQLKETLKGLKEGEVNILIGTHRILGKDVVFADLGLLIVDEEQKFGVSVKEKLRQLKVNVDTLTLTATPIPRTLQFSLMGARDLSVIATPPPNRYPIQTEVHTFSPDVITEAIQFEMSRNGQVFFVNNRIAQLAELKALINRHIPDCRVVIGHGQMPPTELEQVVLDFVNYDYDVLLSTTIIESGIDIPNANTIIINEAHHFGLSDLHQMRGRVGRSNRKAFCYLLAPPLSGLTTESRRRLQAIENFSDLGSGIHIAMQDLDIRGAGNLLGAEQSGFITDLGYETYQKILQEAITELRTDEFASLYASSTENEGDTRFVDECQVESDLELLLPESYVTGSSERMLLYRELDGLTTDEEVNEFRNRLNDRFGTPPHETEELLRIVPLKRMAAELGAERLFLKGGRLSLFFVSNPDSPFYQSEAFGRIIAYMLNHPRRCDLKEQNTRRSLIVKDVDSVESALEILKDILNTVPGD
ncbi:MAG: transcription-repair coupling factor [Bacteroides sp.]|nr:transcription-repair coupling factor [Bacteroides sp.]